MTQHKPWDRIKVTRIFLLLLLDILLINLSSFLALFTRMELDLTALLESGFLDSIYRYALMDTVCTILIFWAYGYWASPNLISAGESVPNACSGNRKDVRFPGIPRWIWGKTSDRQIPNGF